MPQLPDRPGAADPLSAAAGDDKTAWRTRLLAARAAVPLATRAAEAAALVEHLRAAVLPGLAPGQTLAAFLPVGDEPGSLALLDLARAEGLEVIAPLTGPPGPLDWAHYRGADRLVTARYGLAEPDGPALGPAALSAASVVLIPALAVDRRGIRLGRGAGYYDRTLAHARPGARLIAVVRDAELVDRLPADPHDVPMTAALTPEGGLITLGG